MFFGGICVIMGKREGGAVMMKCPVCDGAMDASVCGCGYDISRDYRKYPTLGSLPEGLESVSALRERREDDVRCAGCGAQRFRLSRSRGMLLCDRCGRALTAEELKPLTEELGLAQTKKRKKPAPKKEKDPKRIVSVALGSDHTVVLLADGTVKATGGNLKGQCEVDGWRDIAAISAGYNRTIGVKKDGTVVVAGAKGGGMTEAAKWTDMAAVAVWTNHVVGLKKDGTVINAGNGRCSVYGWGGLTAIAAGHQFTVGLRTNGTVVTSGTGAGAKLPWLGWKNIRAISAGRVFTVGLKKDGSVVAMGNCSAPVGHWRNITAISAGTHHVVGLKHDGTAVAAGDDPDGRCKVDGWKNLAAVYAGGAHTVGLRKDGTLVAAGCNSRGQCDVEKLME